MHERKKNKLYRREKSNPSAGFRNRRHPYLPARTGADCFVKLFTWLLAQWFIGDNPENECNNLNFHVSLPGFCIVPVKRGFFHYYIIHHNTCKLVINTKKTAMSGDAIVSVNCGPWVEWPTLQWHNGATVSAAFPLVSQCLRDLYPGFWTFPKVHEHERISG